MNPNQNQGQDKLRSYFSGVKPAPDVYHANQVQKLPEVIRISDFVIKRRPTESNTTTSPLPQIEKTAPPAPDLTQVNHSSLQKVVEKKEEPKSEDKLQYNASEKNVVKAILPVPPKINELIQEPNVQQSIPAPELNAKIYFPKNIHRAGKSSRGRWIFAFALISICALISTILGSVSIALAQSHFETGEKYNLECKKELFAAERKGLDTNNFSCEELDWWSKLTKSAQAADKLQAFKDSVTKQESELLSQIKQTNDQISKLENGLKILGIQFDQEITSDQDLLNSKYADLLNSRKNRLNELTDLVRSNQDKVDLPLKEMQFLTQKKPKLTTKELQDFVESYNNLSLEQKIFQIQEFNSKYKRFRNVVIANGGVYQPFSPESIAESKDPYFLFNNIQYENVRPILSTEIGLTGDAKTDAYIYKKAELRGYRIQLQANEDSLFASEEVKLQPKAMKNWEEMKAAAEQDGVKLKLNSGYRSVQDQIQLFQEKMTREMKIQGGKTLTNDQILKGEGDKILDSVLKFTSPPGYSQHHSGYSLDINDESEEAQGEPFEKTSGYKWLSANNFENAKKFGFINTYYKQGVPMGAEPEAWHFMWVGTDNLKY
ncbi:MAG: hypothetical protein OHK0017_13290 [Patescibacteria group bacterium]